MKKPTSLAVAVLLIASAVLCTMAFLSSSNSKTADQAQSNIASRQRHLQSRSYCTCPSCDTDVWNAQAGSSTCGKHRNTLAQTMSNKNACREVANAYPDACGACNPDTCHDDSSSGAYAAAADVSSSSTSGTRTTMPRLQIMGDNGSPADVFPLGNCQGDCDDDSDCASGLFCYQRNVGEAVPGCSGGDELTESDYCIPISAPDIEYIGNNNNPSSAFPLGICQGDCDDSGDCESGLACYFRNAGESVPGCDGIDTAADTDYCIDPYMLRSIPPENNNDQDGRSGGDEFGLKIFWEDGYKWQGEEIERQWCMRCDSSGVACTAGHRVYMTNCAVDGMVTQWKFNYMSDSVFQVKDTNSNLCLTIPENILEEPLYVDLCDSSNHRQQYSAENGSPSWNDRFELHPVTIQDGCAGVQHNPKYGEMMYVWKCSLSQQWTTNWWQFY
ncbi:hypothetical protein MPSEU_000047300 [Mayamaea pseudoterrestris]|nr:hypothetical protein MPSEU_000047300 [Mayamaea pseudoterrestris]